MFLPEKNYTILVDIMHASSGEVSNGQKVDGLVLSFKTSKTVSRNFLVDRWKIIEFLTQLFSNIQI